MSVPEPHRGGDATTSKDKREYLIYITDGLKMN